MLKDKQEHEIAVKWQGVRVDVTYGQVEAAICSIKRNGYKPTPQRIRAALRLEAMLGLKQFYDTEKVRYWDGETFGKHKSV